MRKNEQSGFLCTLLPAMRSFCPPLLFVIASAYIFLVLYFVAICYLLLLFLHDCLSLLPSCKLVKLQQVLRDDESRKEYDYMLDHPEEMFGNYYRSSLT